VRNSLSCRVLRRNRGQLLISAENPIGDFKLILIDVTPYFKAT